jgi:hypothetical protein
VPHLINKLRQHDALDLGLAGAVEQAQFDLGRIGRKQCEIDAKSIPDGAKRKGPAFAQTGLARGLAISVDTSISRPATE